jgi:hypothetical protein
MLCDPPTVLREASVVATVPCFYSINRQHADFLTVSSDHDTIVCRQVSIFVEFTVTQTPPHMNWKIAFGYSANCSHSFIEVDFIFSE